MNPGRCKAVEKAIRSTGRQNSGAPAQCHSLLGILKNGEGVSCAIAAV